MIIQISVSRRRRSTERVTEENGSQDRKIEGCSGIESLIVSAKQDKDSPKQYTRNKVEQSFLLLPLHQTQDDGGKLSCARVVSSFVRPM